MAIENQWLTDRRVLLTRLTGRLTIDDLAVSSEQGSTMIENGIAPVTCIVDMSGMDNFPVKPTELHALADGYRVDKLGLIILCGAQDPMVKFLAALYVQMAQVNCQVVSTLDDALSLAARLGTRRLNATL
jgi:hypothetical protein